MPRIAQDADVPAECITGDLADAAFSHSVVSEAWNRWGAVDVVVTAAGIYPAIKFLELTAADWDYVQAVNVRSVMLLTQSLAQLAISASRPAVVIHVSSGAALRARPGASHYSASKAALEMLTRSAAVELGEFGIRVNAVSPGFVDVNSDVNPVTEAYASVVSINPLGRRGRPDDIAGAVSWLASADAEWVTGSVLRVDGGASAGAVGLPLHWTGTTLGQQAGGRDG